MFVKVCGLTDKDNILAISKLNVDFCGFIFYPPSPRYVVDKLPDLNFLSSKTLKTGVFVNEEKTKIEYYLNSYNLDVLQFHGEEQANDIAYFRSKVKVLIKAFRMGGDFDFEITKSFQKVCNFFLFDTQSKRYGGSGQKFNWEILQNYNGKIPFLLSGGIKPEDADEILNLRHPQFAGIDLNSGFEIEKGVKDVKLLQQFLRILRP